MLIPSLCSKELDKTFSQWLRHCKPSHRLRIVQRLSRLVCQVLNDFDPIPVMKGGTHEVMNTLRQSVEALMQGSNLLIFPEHSRQNYADNLQREHAEAGSLRTLYSGFAQIGRMYYDSTGCMLNFVPVYVDRQRRVIRIATAIAYAPTGNDLYDRQTLTQRLYEALQAMSRQH